jgi:hypothetical protein
MILDREVEKPRRRGEGGRVCANIDNEMIPSSPSSFQRETDSIPAILAAPVDMPKDIVVGNKRPV